MASGSDFESSDPVEAAGLSILRLLQRAADTADQNKRQVLDTAQRLSQELRAAQDRIVQLEGDVAAYRNRAERAELWLDKIRTELEQQFPRDGRTRRYD
jgi:predicted  nucleic acid-binding Zn-ribbon protein